MVGFIINYMIMIYMGVRVEVIMLVVFVYIFYMYFFMMFREFGVISDLGILVVRNKLFYFWYSYRESLKLLL